MSATTVLFTLAENPPARMDKALALKWHGGDGPACQTR
jgi:hypothetical protein